MTAGKSHPRRSGGWRIDIEGMRHRHRPERICEAPGCEEEGSYRAPRSPDRLNEHCWFCLDHVREYNEMWDYFAGKDENAIEAFRSGEAIYGERSTWGFGLKRKPDLENIRDYFGFFTETYGHAQHENRTSHLPREERDALRTLSLAFPTTIKAIKVRYRELVKEHHPDANKGDAASEERFKSISAAYRLLVAINTETGRYEDG